MLEDATMRERFSIGNSFEEIEQIVQKIGYPIHLVPFGSRECVIRIKTENELYSKAQEVLDEGFWNLVHVLKPLGKYPDEF